MSEDVIHKINITDGTKRSRFIDRIVFIALPFSTIGTGILAGSSAMQWMGFIVTILTVYSTALHLGKKNNDLKIDQARKRLDEIEAAQ